MLLYELYSVLFDSTDFKLEYPENKWYKTTDSFFPDANKREESDIPEYENYDSWVDYLDYESLEKSQLEEFCEFFSISKLLFLNDKIAKIFDQHNTIWLEEEDDSTFQKLADSDSDMRNEIENMDENSKLALLNIELDDVYVSGWECTIGDCSLEGLPVYHYTTEEKWKSIRKDRGMYTSCGSGLTNRSCYGIFASVSPETYAIGTYGDVLLELDLKAFKNAKGIEKLNLQPEPDVLEMELNSSVAHKLGLESDFYITEDMSPETIIVGHSIPLKYIKRL